MARKTKTSARKASGAKKARRERRKPLAAAPAPEASPTSIRPLLDELAAAKAALADAVAALKAPRAAPAKAKAAVTAELPTVSGWERGFLKRLREHGGVTQKQLPILKRINAKLKALGEAEVEAPLREKGATTPLALGRRFADIQLTAAVVACLKGRQRGASIEAICGATKADEAALQPVLQGLLLSGAIAAENVRGRILYRAA